MSLDLQPTLAGRLLQLRPLEAADREPLYAVAADPLLWEQHPARDRHERAVFEAMFEESLQSGGALVAIDRAAERVIGSSRYAFGWAEPGEVEIGWTFLARSHWGKGANRELKRLMLRHAFGTLDQAMFRVGEANRRSRKALEKIGARLTERTQHALVGGRGVLHVIYTIRAADFAASPLNQEGTAP